MLYYCSTVEGEIPPPPQAESRESVAKITICKVFIGVIPIESDGIFNNRSYGFVHEHTKTR
jgi:hypothetical protein